MPRLDPKTLAKTERSYSNQSRQEVSTDQDYGSSPAPKGKIKKPTRYLPDARRAHAGKA
jgi:hypothetical protein